MTSSTYIQLWENQAHMNWDAALTLGVCCVAICWLAYRPINWVYTKYHMPVYYKDGAPVSKRILNVLLGMITTLVICSGLTAAVILLGVWSAWILHYLGFSQGVLRPYTSQGLIPYHG